MLNILRAELERLFDLAELLDIAARQLDIAPGELSAQRAKGAAAEMLVERARQLEAIEALADLVMVARPGADRRLEELRRNGYRGDEALPAGASFGGYRVESVLGRSALATVYEASQGEARFRLRVLRRAATVDRVALQRYLMASRLSGDLGVQGLPKNLSVVRNEREVSVATERVPGEPLSGQLGTPWKPRKAWSILRSILESLSALHGRRLVHGAVHPDNVMVFGEQDTLATLLVDAGTHHLRSRELVGGVAGRRGRNGPLAYAAPEQLLGELPTARSDVYSFGLLLYALLAGRPAFAGGPQALVKARFSHAPEPLSLVAPRGWILPDFDEIVRTVLDEDPERRPPDAEAVLEMLEVVAAQSVRRTEVFPEDALDSQLQALFDRPGDEVLAASLEDSIGQGAQAGRVAEAFVMAAEQLGGEPSTDATRRRLLTRAGSLYDGPAENPRAAAQAYRSLLELDRRDETALASLERAYRRMGDYQGLVEVLVEHAQQAEPGESKARVLSTVGDLLSNKVGDAEQAIVAYVHAFLSDPGEPSHVRAVERLAGSDKKLWTEVLEVCTREVVASRSPAEKNQRLIVMGGWYRDHLSRLDVALQCFQAIVMTDPAHDAALEAMADLCRRAGQWRELSELLLSRARVAASPTQSRDLLAEAASVLAERLSDPARAIAIYEQVLQDDPSHGQAGQALSELLLHSGRFEDYTRVMKRRVEAAPAPQRARLRFELAEAYEARKLPQEAWELYELAADDDPADLPVLRKLELAYVAMRRPDDLLVNLDRQLALAVTPRQKTSLLERMAGLHLSEFLDKQGAVTTLERIVEIEPGHLPALESLARLYRDLQQWATLAWTLERQAAHLDDSLARADKLLELGALAAGPLHEPAFAIDAYERALLLRPDSPKALDALASLRATEGDQAGAAEALEALADTESEPGRRADFYVRAADILSLRGEVAHAIERYKRALEAVPSHSRANLGLHAAYLAHNDVELAVRCLEAAIATASSRQDKANLSAALAGTLAARTDNLAKAQASAEFAVEFDPNHLPARVLLADLDRRSGRFEGACSRYAALEGSLRELDDKAAAAALCGYAECLARTGHPKRALSVLRDALARVDDRDTVLAASQVAFLAEDFAPSVELNSRLVQEHGRTLQPAELAAALWRRGESLRRVGQLEEAIAPLNRAADLELEGVKPLRALAAIYRAREQWLDLSKTMVRMLGKVQGDPRVELLLEIGELAEKELDDRATAGRCYAAALAERPSDRKLLLKLAQFHRAERDWARLVDAIVKLAELTEEPPQRARYLHTAARLASQEMGDLSKAAELTDRAVAQDPSDESLVAEAIALKQKLGDNDGLELFYQRQIREAVRRNDLSRSQQLAGQLAQLHVSCGRDDDAVAVLEAALEAGGEDPDRERMLLELYAKDAVRYLDRAVRFARSMVARTPRDPEPYRILRRMYADAKRRDATWVACQALTVMGAAEPAEERYFEQYRDAGPMPPHAKLSEREWAELVVHPDADDELTRIFRVLQPIIAKARARTLKDLGLSRSNALDPAACQGTLVESLSLASRVLGVPMPLLFENPKPGNALTMTPCERPMLLLAPTMVRFRLPRPRAAFVAATHLCYLRSGFYVRAFLPKMALKAWLLAAIRATAQPTPPDPEVEGLTRDAEAILEANLVGSMRDHLAEPVRALLKRGGSLSISTWMAGVDQTSDRAGFIVSGLLQPAISVIEESAGGGGLLSPEQRVRSLLQYSVSSQYLTMRDRLRLSVDWVHSDELPVGTSQPPA